MKRIELDLNDSVTPSSQPLPSADQARATQTQAAAATPISPPPTAPAEAPTADTAAAKPTPSAATTKRQQPKAPRPKAPKQLKRPKAELSLLTKLKASLLSPAERYRREQEFRFRPPSFIEIINGRAMAEVVKRHRYLLLILIAFGLVNIALGYLIEAQITERHQLTQKALDARYRALTKSSDLREHSLGSRIETQLRDSTLRPPTQSPYRLPVGPSDEAPTLPAP